MTLNSVVAVILRYFTELSSFVVDRVSHGKALYQT